MMTVEQAVHQYFWHIFFIAATGFYAGYKVGKWWQDEKTKDHPAHNDEMWW
jgi:hypothetical protein